jgi:hypothetical protein
VEARFYLEEIEKRRNDKVSRRDFRMELIVIALIALELIAAVGLAIWGERQQSRDTDRQLSAFNAVQSTLAHVEQSSKETAAAMLSLKNTTDLMNSSIQKQLGFDYEVLLDTEVDQENLSLDIFNKGRTTVLLYGIRRDTYKSYDRNEVRTLKKYFLSTPKPILPGGSYAVDFKGQIDTLHALFPKEHTFMITFYFLLKSKLQQEYLGTLTAIYGDETVGNGVYAEKISVVRAQWNQVLSAFPLTDFPKLQSPYR